MSVDLEVQMSASLDQSSLDGVVGDFEDSFDDLGDSLGSSLDKGASSFSKSGTKTIENALGDSILNGVSNGLDSLDSVWESAWNSLASIAKKALSSALGSLTLDGLGSLFSFSSTSGSSGGSGTTLLSALGLGTKAANSDTGSSWLSSLFGGGSTESLSSGVNSYLDFSDSGAITEAFDALSASGEGAGALAGETLGDFSFGSGFEGLSSMEGLGSLGAEVGAESAAGGLFGLSTGVSVTGAILAPLAIGELASALGLMEGTSPMQALFGEGGGHTQESAQSTITSDMSFLSEAAQAVEDALNGANTGAQTFATTMVTQMSGASLEMSRLAERAGLSDDEIDSMVESLDPANANLVVAAECLGEVNEKLDTMDNVLDQGADSFSGANTAGSEYSDMLLNMANSLDLPAESSDTLTASITSLVEQWNNGQISAETLSTSLKTSFATALTDLATSSSTTTDQLQDLADTIESIPTEWTSTINVVYNTEGDQPTYSHSGGMLMHDGGWLGGLGRYHAGAQVSTLFADEVPLIAQRGEFIVRRDSVNASTLPLLKALNQSGGAASAQPNQVNLHMEVHGNLMGDESAFNDLARLLESKLRDLNQSRYAA
jgi:hypothetical protein